MEISRGVGPVPKHGDARERAYYGRGFPTRKNTQPRSRREEQAAGQSRPNARTAGHGPRAMASSTTRPDTSIKAGTAFGEGCQANHARTGSGQPQMAARSATTTREQPHKGDEHRSNAREATITL